VSDLTPCELRGGLWWKREDLYRIEPYGVNGSKLRACQHLMSRAGDDIYQVVSASSVLSPQAAMAGVVAEELGLECEIIVGATTPEKAMRHKSIAIAVAAGATVRSVPVAYNTYLQAQALEAALRPGVWRLPYGITTPADAPLEDVEAFLQVGGAQVANLPDEVETLVVPFGSANTACGVLYGLHDQLPRDLANIYLVEIGPSRRDWAIDRLESVGRTLDPGGVKVHWITLHDVWATYGDKMPETMEEIVFHPTYEGKMIRWLNLVQPEWWMRRDGTTCFWIVGGPI
jgi:1-aminocyclopropane-1-carboxylate deaminase/D-cysteine desulfhydrase-like pyridoxal-dependent ACC family enzyme